MTAEVVQRCIITLDPFPVELVFPLARFFIAEGARHDHVEELEGDEPDIVNRGAIDLGELAAEELALNLDPYPRKPGAEMAVELGGVQPENVQGRRKPLRRIAKTGKVAKTVENRAGGVTLALARTQSRAIVPRLQCGNATGRNQPMRV